MKKFDLLGYIRRFQLLIIIISALAGIIGYGVLKSKQFYTASAIIKYANDDAVSGLAPDGTEIDTTEIYSAKVISEVFTKLGLDYAGYNIDDMRSGVTVESLRTEEKIALDEAIIAGGEEVEEKPVDYKISFTLQNGASDATEDFARQFLDELLNEYISFYGEEHINTLAPAVNDISTINNQSYDYLEKAEILKDSVTAANDELKKRAEGADVQFRSAATGYNFSDLQKEFLLLKDIDIWDLYGFILENKVTQNKELLLTKYENRIVDYNANNQKSSQHINYIQGVIDAYVNMMRESGNTDITYEYILQDVDSTWYTDPDGEHVDADQTVEYDTLLTSYGDESVNYNNALVEAAYCQYILDVYNGAGGMNNAETQAQAQQMIDSLAEKMNNLFKIMEITNDEYNEYIGAQNIQLVSGIAVHEGIAIKRYALLIALAFGVVGCLGAIVLGRMLEIFEYYVYYDRKLNIPNRAACDRELDRYSDSPLPGDFVCISVKADNLRDKNRIYGMEAADRMLSELVRIMQGIFESERGCFLGFNGAGQFLIFAKHMTAERASAYAEEIFKAVNSYNQNQDCKIAYSIGIAEARKTGTYQIRDLMLRAMRSKDGGVFDEDDINLMSAAALSKSGSASDVSKRLDELKKALKI